MDLAGFIEQFKNEKDLSFRDLEKRAGDLDHAYIWRLTKGDKAMPSQATIQKLSSALELDERKQQIFELLVQMPIDDSLYRLMLDRTDMPWEHFETVAKVSSRGTRRNTEEGWLQMIEIIKDL